MKMTCLIAVAALGIAAPALAQTSPMSGPNSPGGGMHPSAPQTGAGGDGAMSQGRGGSSAGGMHPVDPMGTGDVVVPHHAMNQRHCRMVTRNHHRVRRCM